MAESISPCFKLSYLTPDHKQDREGAEHQIPKEQVLLCIVRDNNDLTKRLGLTSGESAKAAGPVVGEGKSSEASPRKTALTTRLWQGASALTESLIGTTALEILGEVPAEEMSEQSQLSGEQKQQVVTQTHNSIPDDLLIFGDGMMSAEGVESKSSRNETHPNQVKEGDGKTWGQWAAEKALAAEQVAAQGAVLVKDSAVSTAKYVAEAATSKLHGDADPTTKDDVSNGHNKTSVQDGVDRYSTTARTPEGGERSVTRAPTMKERTLTMAQSLKHSTATALTPGEGDKELAETITASLSSLPTLLRERMWISSDSEDPAVTGPFVSGVGGVGAAASLERSLQDVKSESGESKPEASSAVKETDEEKLNAIRPEKLRELWTIGSGNLDVKNGGFDSESLWSPQSPKTPTSATVAAAIAAAAAPAASLSPKAPEASSSAAALPTYSPRSVGGTFKFTNEKAAALAEANRSRVIVEANAYMEAEFSKAEAHAQKMHAKAESQRLREEAKATENLKEEERRAELLMHNAEVKAGKMLAEAKSTAGSIESSAEEEYARNMADSKTKADRWLAEIEETKQRELAEMYDRVEEMMLMGQFPLTPPEHKKESVVKKVKAKVMSRVRGY